MKPSVNIGNRTTLRDAADGSRRWSAAAGSSQPASLEYLRTFVDDYRAYADRVLVPLQGQLDATFASWRQPDYWERDDRPGATTPIPSPVKRVAVRIKEPKAVVRKILAKPDAHPHGLTAAGFRSMTDVLGARVIVYFLSELPMIDREIREGGIFEVSPFIPPHAYMPSAIFRKLGLKMKRKSKPSGYMSLHYVVRLRGCVIPGEQCPWFELQLRTFTQDLWAEIEHLLGYKHNSSSAQVRGQFQLISRLLGTIDEQFDLLRAEQARRQSDTFNKNSDVLNADNLPAVLAERGLACAQYDIAGLLKMAAGSKVETVGDLREVLTPDNVNAVREASRTAIGQRLVGGNLLAALLMLFGRNRAMDLSTALKNWSQFNAIFDDLKTERR